MASEELLSVLKARFGLPGFREGQQEIIQAVLAGSDVIAVMPTGGGKSLCYQLPALLLPGITIVVSPLIALMKDQVDSLKARGIPADLINSTVAPEEVGRRLREAERGQIKLLYVAPERFRSQVFLRSLVNTEVSLFAVDEAHCLSQWGHDFRPDYLKLAGAIETLGRPRVAAFTATATGEVRQDIGRHLGLRAPATFFAGIDRDNLFLEFSYPSGKGERERKIQAIVRMVQSHRNQTGIIYASTRKNVQIVTERLLEARIQALSYHAGMEDSARSEAQEKFMAGHLQVIVATNAFGMGVDKSDIRYVVHHDFPGSIEAYYQEVGRAGRDGLPARCLTLFSERDRYIQEFFHQGSNPSRQIIEGVYHFLREAGASDLEMTVAEIAARIPAVENDMAVSTSLKVLEGFGVISRGYRGENRGFLRLRHPPGELIGYLNRAPVQRAVLQAVAETCMGDPVTGAEIDLGALAFEAQVDREAVGRVLLELEKAGYVDYEPPFRGRKTTLLKRTDTLDIDWSILDEKAQRDFAKIDRMMGFARSEACRKWYLRRYFLGDGGKTWCGSCDRCQAQALEEAAAAAAYEERRLARASRTTAPTPSTPASSGSKGRKQVQKTSALSRSLPPPIPLEGDLLVLAQKILACVARMRGRFGRTRIAQVLKGSRDKEVLKWDLNNLTTYGILGDLKQEDILAAIDALVTAGLLALKTLDEDVTHRMAVVELTEEGREVMVGRRVATVRFAGTLHPQPPRSEVRAEDPSRGHSDAPHKETVQRRTSGGRFFSDPASRRIFDALVRWRLERARADNVPAYVILHNSTLEEIARMRPGSVHQLMQVPGMGSVRCQRFGQEILGVVLERTRLDREL